MWRFWVLYPKRHKILQRLPIMDYMPCSTVDRKAAELWSVRMVFLPRIRIWDLSMMCFQERYWQNFRRQPPCVGHVRYGTTGGNNRSNCQPIEVNHQKGKMALAHNGNISNAYSLRDRARTERCDFPFHKRYGNHCVYHHPDEIGKAPSIEEALL